MEEARRQYSVDVRLWWWSDALCEIQRRMQALGVRGRLIRSRWHGLSVELVLDARGTEQQLRQFLLFLDSLRM